MQLKGIVGSIVLIKSTLAIRVLLILVFRTGYIASGRRWVKGYAQRIRKMKHMQTFEGNSLILMAERHSIHGISEFRLPWFHHWLDVVVRYLFHTTVYPCTASGKRLGQSQGSSAKIPVWCVTITVPSLAALSKTSKGLKASLPLPLVLRITAASMISFVGKAYEP